MLNGTIYIKLCTHRIDLVIYRTGARIIIVLFCRQICTIFTYLNKHCEKTVHRGLMVAPRFN
jgi:hypothetical protein